MKPTLDPAWRCVGYLRVSTKRQAAPNRTSLQFQRDAIVAYASRMSMAVGHWYEDHGSGATAHRRPAFMSLVADCEAQPRDADSPGYVLVDDVSRFGRFDDLDEFGYWRFRLKLAGWIVVYCNESSDEAARAVLRVIRQMQLREEVEE